MTIQEILEAHTGRTFDSDGMYVCQCGHYIGTNKGKADRHRAHVAEVLDKHMQEREYRAWSNGFHKGRKTENGSHISTWPKNPYRTEAPNGR